MKKTKIYILPAVLIIIALALLLQYRKSASFPATGLVKQTPKSNPNVPFLNSPYNENGDLTDIKRAETAIKTVELLSSSLPIYEKFTASNGIQTEIAIYKISVDRTYFIHLDINGINYGESGGGNDSPNSVAFSESFGRAVDVLKEKGVGIRDLYVIFGGKKFIQDKAREWIVKYNLVD